MRPRGTKPKEHLTRAHPSYVKSEDIDAPANIKREKEWTTKDGRQIYQLTS